MAKTVAIIGAGPAGLMAADSLSRKGYSVSIFDRKPTAARKFLMAGRGGLNITHSEPLEIFITRYGEASGFLRPALENFAPDNLRAWCENFGEKTFIGTSGRVFPENFKASPLLRAWLKQLNEQDVTFHMNHTWTGWNKTDECQFTTSDGTTKSVKADATILALGGASWPKLGSDGSWTKILEKENIAISPLRPANCGFVIAWSDIFKNKFAGTPIKSVALTHNGQTVRGEIMISQNGLEGSAIYALSKFIRTAIEETGTTTLTIDLKPDLTIDQLNEKLSKSRGRDSQTNFLRKQTGLSPAAINLIYECADKTRPLAEQIKKLPVTLTAPFPIDRAISSAGGINLDELTTNFALKNKPDTFAIGEMLDWEAPTGGYLLQACFSMGVFAAIGVDKFLKTGTIPT